MSNGSLVSESACPDAFSVGVGSGWGSGEAVPE